MEVEDLLFGDEISLFSGDLELLVVPVDDTDPVSLAVGQVAGQVAPHPGPEERRDPPVRRQVILVDVVQHLEQSPVITRLERRFTLSSSDMKSSISGSDTPFLLAVM